MNRARIRWILRRVRCFTVTSPLRASFLSVPPPPLTVYLSLFLSPLKQRWETTDQMGRNPLCSPSLFSNWARWPVFLFWAQSMPSLSLSFFLLSFSFFSVRWASTAGRAHSIFLFLLFFSSCIIFFLWIWASRQVARSHSLI